MEEYTKYKDWWIAYEAPHKVPSLYWGGTADEGFKQHIKDMTLYELMEILSNRR